jgi:hypothetical protein
MAKLPPERGMARRLQGLSNIYGITVQFPPELSAGLAACAGRPEITVIGEIGKSTSQESITWYHTWFSGKGDPWLSAGISRRRAYRLRFHEDGTEFVITRGGAHIYYHRPPGVSPSSVRHYLNNQVIPMVLNYRGTEVLHASSIVADEGALVFVGNGGYGKSTIAASLLDSGFRLLSDDAVPIQIRRGQVWTESGPAEINLWPRMHRLLSKDPGPSNSVKKQILAVPQDRHQVGKLRVARIYLLQPSSGSSVSITSLEGRECLIELVRSAHRLDLKNGSMLQRQLEILHQVSSQVAFRRLRFPAGLPEPQKVLGAILGDLVPTHRRTRTFSKRRSKNTDLSAAQSGLRMPTRHGG